MSHENLMDAADKPARTLSQMPPITLQMIKQLIQTGLESNFDAQIRSEAYADSLLLQTEDHKEANLSFIEKRPPIFKGK